MLKSFQDKLKLGILYKDGEIVNHRSLVKFLANPLLRRFGFCIGTKLDNGQLKGPKLIKSAQVDFSWDVNNHNDFDAREPTRCFF